MARHAILVLGMHRSGTSAISRVVNLLGAAGPARTLPPGPDNPSGFWESAPVTRLNDEILAAGHSSWTDWTRFDPARLPAGTLPALLPRMEAALRQEFGDAPMFVLKDPRLSRLLPLWQPALERVGAVPSAIVALRHPAAIARSLAVRNGMTLEQSILLWLRHVLDAERLTQGIARDFVAYDALLANWRGVLSRTGDRLGLEWPLPLAAAAPGVAAFLDARLRHGRAEEIEFGSAYAEVWTRHAWAALCALEESGAERAALEALDRVRSQFEDACRLFAPPRPRAAMAKPDLGAVTLCAADSRTVPLTVRALLLSAARCDFADTVLFTDAPVAGPIRSIPIAPIGSREAYSGFVLRGLADHIVTSHALIVQWDGYVTAPEAWQPEFLQYDYIGAPWGRYADGMDVGNGGFSLRSRRLLQALQDPRFAPVADVAEDELIGRVWRPVLEHEFGLRFAPDAVASRFAYERVLPAGPTFGFHGLFNLWRHMDDAELAAFADLLPDAVLAELAFAQLVAMCFLQGRQAGLAALAGRWAAHASPTGIAGKLRPILGAALQDCLQLMGVVAEP